MITKISNLQTVGLGYLSLNRGTATLSGGELQRVKLAKILLQNQTNISVLDEPTSGLHEANVQNMIDLLKELIRQRSLSVIVIEHNLRVMSQQTG